MTGHLRQVPLGARTVSVQSRAELAHNSTNSCRVTTEKARSVPRSRTITRHNRPNISEYADERQTNNLLGQSPNGWSDCFSNFSYIHWREATKFEKVSSPKQPVQ